MGKIARFKQGQLSSSVVGTPGVNQAAGAIAGAIGRASDTLRERQKALNDVKAQNKFFDYQQQDDILQTKLQKQFSLSPEAYRTEYKKQSQQLIGNLSQGVPESSLDKFNSLVNSRSVTTNRNNLKWVFSQQNKVALDGVNEMGAKFGAAASTKASADQFMELVGEFSISFDDTAGKILDGLSAKTAKRKFMETGFDGFRRGMLEPSNGGAIQYQNDLLTNKKFQDMIVGAFGEEGLQKLQKEADTSVKALVGKKAFQTIINLDGNSRELFVKQYASQEGLSLVETGENLRFAENALTTTLVESQNQNLDLTTQIAYLEENVRQARSMDSIARAANNHLVVTNPTVKTELNAEIKDLLIGVSGQTGLAALKAETSRQLKKTLGSEKLFGPGGTKTITAPSGSSRVGKEAGIRRSISDYLVGLTLIEGKILKAREDGQINDSDANSLLNQFMPQLKVLDSYDRVAAGTDAFSQMYAEFDAMVSGLTIPGISATSAATQRDSLRNAMVDSFIARSFEINKGMDLIGTPSDLRQGPLRKLVLDVKREFLRSFLPADLQGVTTDDFITVQGRTVPVAGTHPQTGQIIIKVPKSIKDEVANI